MKCAVHNQHVGIDDDDLTCSFSNVLC